MTFEDWDEQYELPLSSLPRRGIHNPYTHKPKDPRRCHVCRLSKMRHVRKAHNPAERETLKFGDLVTCDFKSHHDHWKLPGVGGAKAALNLVDHNTLFKGHIPLSSETTEDTAWAIRQYRGDDEIRRMYSDNARNIIAAAADCKNPLRALAARDAADQC